MLINTVSDFMNGDLFTIQGQTGVYVYVDDTLEPYKKKPSKKQVSVSNKPAYASISSSGHYG